MPDRRTVVATAIAAAFAIRPARAALAPGRRAPDFTAPAVIAGEPFTFSLSAALARGPVVLYFFPAAFSEACSIEARAFAEAVDDFAAVGAVVVGVTGGDVATLSRFSVKVCNGRFAIVSDASRAIMTAYDAVMPSRPDFAMRVSYVIATDGTVVLAYADLSPHDHVDVTLAALRDGRRRQR